MNMKNLSIEVRQIKAQNTYEWTVYDDGAAVKDGHEPTPMEAFAAGLKCIESQENFN